MVTAGTRTFDDFFVVEYPRLVVMLTASFGDRATAEDIAQDALLQAERRWDDVRWHDRPGAWVRRAALNRAANEHRRRSRERRAKQRLATPPDNRPGEPRLPDGELWAAVRALPRAQRDATLLRYVDDLPLADIGEILGCREGTVKHHLLRARRALAAQLSSTDAMEAE